VTDTQVHSIAAMGTVVTIEVPDRLPGRGPVNVERLVERALRWFAEVESTCSRFDPASELRHLCERPGRPVPVSDMLFETIRFAIAVAGDTGGAFDPTVGAEMVAQGFDTEFRSGRRMVPSPEHAGATYHDVLLDASSRTITLQRPLLLDLGAVAKGLAIDMAARELAPLRDFVVEAGGDLFASGSRGDGTPWTIGIRHPRGRDALLGALEAADVAVCTSGDYERVGAGGHHLLQPRRRVSSGGVSSVTVLAPSAMVADALATAAFVLGPDGGLALLRRHGVAGMIVTATLVCLRTTGFPLRVTRPVHGLERTTSGA